MTIAALVGAGNAKGGGAGAVSLRSGGNYPRERTGICREAASVVVAGLVPVLTEAALPQSCRLGFVQAFDEMVMQVGVLEESGARRSFAQELGLGDSAMPFLCGEIALADAH